MTQDESAEPTTQGDPPPGSVEDASARLSSDFTESFDARDWAEAFAKHVVMYPGIPADVDTLTGWFANAIMRGYDEHARQQRVNTPSIPAHWNPTEALFAFTALLTTKRDLPPLGASEDAAPWVGLLRDFCERHHLPEIRDGWEKLIIPEGRDQRV